MAGAALQRVLVDSWLRRGALAWLLAPIALVYGRLVAARRWLYSRQILQAHGGEICAENNPGGGSTFRIFLPSRGFSDTQTQV